MSDINIPELEKLAKAASSVWQPPRHQWTEIEGVYPKTKIDYIQAAANSAPELCRMVRELESMSRFLLDSCHVAEPFKSKCESTLASVKKMMEEQL